MMLWKCIFPYGWLNPMAELNPIFKLLQSSPKDRSRGRGRHRVSSRWVCARAPPAPSPCLDLFLLPFKASLNSIQPDSGDGTCIETAALPIREDRGGSG